MVRCSFVHISFAALAATAVTTACNGRVSGNDDGANVTDTNDASSNAGGDAATATANDGGSSTEGDAASGLLYNPTPPARTCPQRSIADGTMAPIDDGKGGSFCMDTTEVTREAYANFLATSPSHTNVASCAGVSDFTVATSGACEGAVQDGDSVTLPVSCVTWCDAAAYCAWTGKRLCRSDGSDVTDPKNDEWFRACSAGGTREYPYGEMYDDSACDAKGSQSGIWAPQEVSFYAGCIDATRRIHDLSGNVEEWEDACESGVCAVRGGSYQSIMTSRLACASKVTASMNDVDPSRGFRCCAD